MSCFIACMIWIGKTGYKDTCSAKVEVRYSSYDYYYITVLQGPTYDGSKVKMDIQIHQRVKKDDCT